VGVVRIEDSTVYYGSNSTAICRADLLASMWACPGVSSWARLAIAIGIQGKVLNVTVAEASCRTCTHARHTFPVKAVFKTACCDWSGSCGIDQTLHSFRVSPAPRPYHFLVRTSKYGHSIISNTKNTSTQGATGKLVSTAQYILRFQLDSEVCRADLHNSRKHVDLHTHQRLHRLP
jgi:hypothetical protein